MLGLLLLLSRQSLLRTAHAPFEFIFLHPPVLVGIEQASRAALQFRDRIFALRGIDNRNRWSLQAALQLATQSFGILKQRTDVLPHRRLERGTVYALVGADG